MPRPSSSTTPRQFLAVTGDRLPERFRRKMESYRYGPGVFKIDWALSAPIPWKAGECARAGTVHVGGSLEEIAESERTQAAGHAAAQRPFVLVTQPSLFWTRAAHPKAGIPHGLIAMCRTPRPWI